MITNKRKIYKLVTRNEEKDNQILNERSIEKKICGETNRRALAGQKAVIEM